MDKDVQFLQKNKIIKYIIVIVLIISIVNFFNKPEEIKKEENINAIDKEQILKDRKIKIICGFIQEHNSLLGEEIAFLYARKIVNESEKKNLNPYIQAALLKSETDFRNDVKHDIADVIGLGGIYYSVWGDKLKSEGIISNKADLKNPMKNIEASSFILAEYTKISKTSTEALARYKGYCKLGKQQGKNVMVIAKNLQKIEDKMNIKEEII